jgi:hypothetical protein
MKKFVLLWLCLSLSIFTMARAMKPSHTLGTVANAAGEKPIEAEREEVAAEEDTDTEVASNDDDSMEDASDDEGEDMSGDDSADDESNADAGDNDGGADDGGDEGGNEGGDQRYSLAPNTFRFADENSIKRGSKILLAYQDAAR